MTLLRLPAPKTAEDFEAIALSIIRHVWQDPNATLLGRNGQSQYGIDAFGQARYLASEAAVAQFRNVKKLSVKEVLEALLAMDGGLPPPLPKLFVVVTSAQRDARVQLELRRISDERRAAALSEVTVLFWEDVEDVVRANEGLLRTHYPDLAPRRLNREEEARLRAQNAVMMSLQLGGAGFEGVEGRLMLGCNVVNKGETPFWVEEVGAEWWFTEAFLALEPTYPAGVKNAEVKVFQARAAPGLYASVTAFMDSGKVDNARLWKTLNRLRGVSPVRARIRVTCANAAGTVERREAELCWPPTE